MKNNSLILFSAFVLLSYSCEKDLDLIPKTSFTEASFFTTADQYKLFANQFYFYLPNVGQQNGREMYSDIVAARSTNTVSNGSYFPTESSDVWNNSYSQIRNTTYLIQKEGEMTTDLKSTASIYIGEAKFFRALAYFNLLRDFGGVPIIDKILDLKDENYLYGPRNTREEVVSYILKDLDEAVSVLPVESDLMSGDKGRISKGAVNSLIARVALFEGTWRKFRQSAEANEMLDRAISASDQVIKSNEYQLFDRRDVLGNESYRYFLILDKIKSNVANLTKDNQKEYILSNRYDNVIRIQPKFLSTLQPYPTRKFADLFLCTDGLPIDKSPLFQGKQTVTSEYENRDLRMKNILLVHGTQSWEGEPVERARNWNNPNAGGYIVDISFGGTTNTGYKHYKFDPEMENPKTSMDFPVIRYAEVLLIYAEAVYEKNDAITDAELDNSINKLRSRAGLPNLTNAFASSNGLDMRNEIRRERTIELFMEDQRFDDLRRWKTAEVEMPKPLLGVLLKGTQFQTDPLWAEVSLPMDSEGYIIVEDASKRKFEPRHYLFPIPTRQILLNPKLVQNPGWE